jgi:tight adherence protein B
MILFVLPFLVAVLLFIVNPSYMRELFDDPRGRVIIGVALGMMLIGVYFIRRIINLKV